MAATWKWPRAWLEANELVGNSTPGRLLDSWGLEAEGRGHCPSGVWLSLLCQRGAEKKGPCDVLAHLVFHLFLVF